MAYTWYISLILNTRGYIIRYTRRGVVYEVRVFFVFAYKILRRMGKNLKIKLKLPHFHVIRYFEVHRVIFTINVTYTYCPFIYDKRPSE